MALDDYVEPEVAVAVAVTAAVLSPPVRKVLRQGAVYGMAGLLMAGDLLQSVRRGVARTAQQVMPEGSAQSATEGTPAAVPAANS